MIPIINFILFDNTAIFDTIDCTNPIEYILLVTLNETELYKYNPNNEYYFDNCTLINELSIYDRKKEYNDKYLS